MKGFGFLLLKSKVFLILSQSKKSKSKNRFKADRARSPLSQVSAISPLSIKKHESGFSSGHYDGDITSNIDKTLKNFADGLVFSTKKNTASRSKEVSIRYNNKESMFNPGNIQNLNSSEFSPLRNNNSKNDTTNLKEILKETNPQDIAHEEEENADLNNTNILFSETNTLLNTETVPLGEENPADIVRKNDAKRESQERNIDFIPENTIETFGDEGKERDQQHKQDEIALFKEDEVEEYRNDFLRQNQVENPAESNNNNPDSWEYEIKTHPRHVLKHMNNIYNSFNIQIKDCGFDIFEISKDKVVLQSKIKDMGHRMNKKICYKLLKGNKQKAFEMMEKIEKELMLLESKKKKNL